jgi:hypothetical protein
MSFTVSCCCHLSFTASQAGETVPATPGPVTNDRIRSNLGDFDLRPIFMTLSVSSWHEDGPYSSKSRSQRRLPRRRVRWAVEPDSEGVTSVLSPQPPITRYCLSHPIRNPDQRKQPNVTVGSLNLRKPNQVATAAFQRVLLLECSDISYTHFARPLSDSAAHAGIAWHCLALPVLLGPVISFLACTARHCTRCAKKMYTRSIP